MIIKIIAANFGLLGTIEVTEKQEFSVEKVTEEAYRRPLEQRLEKILQEPCLPLYPPAPRFVSAVAYYKKGDPLYPLAVAEEFGDRMFSDHKRILDFTVWAEVVVEKG